jgi:hypothetical protein
MYQRPGWPDIRPKIGKHATGRQVIAAPKLLVQNDLTNFLIDLWITHVLFSLLSLSNTTAQPAAASLLAGSIPMLTDGSIRSRLAEASTILTGGRDGAWFAAIRGCGRTRSATVFPARV